MIPEDDATWPSCKHDDRFMRHWCSDVRDRLLGSGDADTIEPGGRYCVPIVPMLDLFAEVSIAPELLGGRSAKLALVAGAEDPFGITDDFIELGLWTMGEGRLVISAVISDWVQGYMPEGIPVCSASHHGFKQEMEVQQAKDNQTSTKASKWCMAYYNHCWPCEFAKREEKKANPIVPFEASSFGLDPKAFGGITGNYRPTTRDQRTRQQLQNKFGGT